MRDSHFKDSSQTVSDTYALLIGINYYFPKSIPNAPNYESLSGCVRDINNVEEFLKLKLGIPDKNIFKLTSSSSNNNGGPVEDPDEWPTYENITSKFDKIIESTKKGDNIYIHYSGHGGRVPTKIPGKKGQNGLDETLVPMNIGNPGTRYIRDIEMATYIKRMVDKGLFVTLILDSCHSGGLTRGRGSATVRGISIIDRTQRPEDSLVASIDELSNNWEIFSENSPSSSSKTRNIGFDTSGGLPPSKGYVLLAACRPSESAYEFAFDGYEKNGALTYYLLKTFANIDKNVTYRLIHDQIVAKIHTKFSTQTPILEGEGDRVVFGSDYIDNVYAINVMEVDETKEAVLLNTGQVHGIRKGALFAVYPYGFSDYTQKDKRLAIVEITERGSTNSWAKIKTNYNKGIIEQGSQAVLIDLVSIELIKKVRLIDFSQNTDNILINELEKERMKAKLEDLKTIIVKEGKGFVELASEDNDKADFQVNINDKQEYEIWDPAGNEIPNINPKLNVNDKSSALRLVERLVHLAKYTNIQQLDNYDTKSTLRGKLSVELFGVSPDFELGDKPNFQSLESEDNTKIAKTGQKLVVRVKNNFPINSDQILNIAILDLQPDWGISQIYPPTGFFVSIDPGQEELFPLIVDLPTSYNQGKDIIKVLAVIDHTNFRWLELDPLDQPLSPQKSGTRGITPRDALENLMSAMTNDKAVTRNVIIPPNASNEWTCIQIELQINR